jgi:hypothetical protein
MAGVTAQPVGRILPILFGKFQKAVKVANTFSTQRVKGPKIANPLKALTL